MGHAREMCNSFVEIDHKIAPNFKLQKGKGFP